MKQNYSFTKRVSAIAATSSLKSFLKSTFRLLPLICLLAISGNAWGAETIFELNYSEQSTSHNLFSVNTIQSKYVYSNNSKIEGWNLFSFAKDVSYIVKNELGVKITAISVSGVADNNSNKSTTITISDGTNSITTGSSSWNNRKSTDLTTKAFSASNVANLKMDKGTEYTFTTTYNIGMKIAITYEPIDTPTPPSYTVTYDANGGTCDRTSDTYTGEALTLPTPDRGGITSLVGMMLIITLLQVLMLLLRMLLLLHNGLSKHTPSVSICRVMVRLLLSKR